MSDQRELADETAALVTLDREHRRTIVSGAPAPSPPGLPPEGIDRVEVLSNLVTAADHVAGAPVARTLVVHLVRGPVPSSWDASTVSVVGGVRADPRLNPVGVAWAYPALRITGTAADPDGDPLPGVTPADRALLRQAVGESLRAAALVVRTTSHGDLSRYLLRLHAAGGTGLPDGIDPPLAQDSFSFAVDCPSDADCATPPAAPAPSGPSPVLDYLARDYPALRTRLLDRLAGLLPGWTDRSPADPAVTLVELFAYEGDRLAYWQDAVGVEAYLATARRRTSVRRHARLLGHAVHEGCAARTWIAMTTDTAIDLPAGTGVADCLPDQRMGLPAGPGSRTPASVVEIGGVVMETMARAAMLPERNAVALHPWGDPEHTLVAGTTSAFLAVPTGEDPALAAGDVLVLAELPRGGGAPEDGDPAHRYAVRLTRTPVARIDVLAPAVTVLEVRWAAADALPGPLVVAERGSDGLPVARAVALANVVLADQGATISGDLLDPPQVPDGVPYRPRLRRRHLTFAEPVDPAALPCAAAAAGPDPRRAVAGLTLDDGARTWTARPDLLASGRLDSHVVVEAEDDGLARLRFGDGVMGRRPAVGSVPRATYRVGEGAQGNVAPGTLTHLLDRPDGSLAVPDGAQVTVWNPLRASGGADPEPIEAVRRLAPYAIGRQLRAVTPRDHADVAEAQEGVQRAVARRRWTGSWYAVEVTVDPVAARAQDLTVPAAVLSALEGRRMAGTDVEVAGPVAVPLHLEVTGCVAPGHLRADVEVALRGALSSRLLPGGRRGFFHPDAFTFGQPLFLSDLVAAAMAVPGIDWVKVTRFARAGAPDRDTAAALAAGAVTVAPREVLRCDTDPNNPEAGTIDLVLRGGA